MVHLIYGPTWFYGTDIGIDIISILVLILISYFSWQYYKVNKSNKNYKTFFIATLFIALSFIFKILTYLAIYTHILESHNITSLTIIYKIVEHSELFFLSGILIYRALSLVGFYFLYSLYYKNKLCSHSFLAIYLLIVIALFTSSAYFIIHITTLLLLVLILRKIYTRLQSTKDKPARYIFVSFLLIALSQLIFIFMGFSNICYVSAEGIQLIGYLLLLFGFIMVIYYGKKKNKS